MPRRNVSNIPVMLTKLRQYNVYFSNGNSRMYRAETVETVRRLAEVTAKREGIRVVSIA